MLGRFLVVFIWFFLALTCFLAGGTHLYARSLLVVNANNKVCPVTNEKIKQHKFNTVYAGRRYWISSYKALRAFKEAPEKYIDASGKRIKHAGK